MFTKNKKISSAALLFVAAIAVIGYLLTHRLASLTFGFSTNELRIASLPIGWHGILASPLFLVFKLFESVSFYFFGQQNILAARLPSVLLGLIAVTAFGLVLRAWHNSRIAILGCLLFATSAWTLHVSRYVGYESSYLVVLPILLLSQVALRRYKKRWLTYAVLVVWSLLLFTPGMIWFVAVAAFWQRNDLVQAWQESTLWWQKVLFILFNISSLPLLIWSFVKHNNLVVSWLGAPSSFDSLQQLGHRLAAVPLHLFVRGPGIPDLWLGRLPLLDIFTLSMTIIGIVFYAGKWRNSRSQLLAAYGVIGTILIGLGGPVSLSLLVPILYLFAAAGMGWLLHDWLKYFPNNPIARGLAIGVVSFAVATSCTYNIYSYYVAWPHNAATITEYSAGK